MHDTKFDLDTERQLRQKYLESGRNYRPPIDMNTALPKNIAYRKLFITRLSLLVLDILTLASVVYVGFKLLSFSFSLLHKLFIQLVG